jgi:hypothetical protein
LAFGVTSFSERVDSDELPLEVPRSSSNDAETDLESFRLSNGMVIEKFMNRLVGDDEGKAIGKFKTSLAEVSCLAYSGGAESGLMDQLKRDPWLDLFGGFPRPLPQEVPGPQA